ncbi:porin [Caulobacter sp. 17J65-9]|nr:porin [Caulobacter sp. 17J65-9]
MRNNPLLAGAALGVLAAVALGAAAQAQELSTAWKGAPEFSNDDVKFKVRGRILVDGVYEDVDRETGVDFSARQVRGRQVFLGVEGQLNSQWAYKIEGGWVNGGTPSWDDVVIEYKPTEQISLMAGNLKVASLENLTSTRFTSFMDRGPFADVTDASYTLGVVGKYVSNYNWSAAVGVTGGSINDADVAAGNGVVDAEERLGVTGRFTYAPIVTDTDKLHLGLWGRYRDAGSEAFTYQARPNTNYGNRYVSTGGYATADTTYAAELAYVHNNFSVQGEYAVINAEGLTATATKTADAEIKTGYAYVSWFPTGESRNYDVKKAEFGRQKVLNPTTAGGAGAIELLARYDYADLTDAHNVAPAATPWTGTLANAGEYTGVTLGANYYPFPYVKFVANYTVGKNDLPNKTITNGVAKNDVDVNVFQLRAQLDF